MLCAFGVWCFSGFLQLSFSVSASAFTFFLPWPVFRFFHGWSCESLPRLGGQSELSFIHWQEKKNIVFCPQALPQKWEEFSHVPRGRSSLLPQEPIPCVAEGFSSLIGRAEYNQGRKYQVSLFRPEIRLGHACGLPGVGGSCS